MKKLLVFICLSLIVFSCKKTSEKPVSLTFEQLKVDKKIFASNDSTKPYMKLTLDFTYPVAFSNDTILDRIQKIFVYAFAGEDYAGRSPKGAFEAYEKKSTDESLQLASAMKDDLSLFGECYEKIVTNAVDTSKNIITVKTEFSSYMGGAHGAYNVFYYNIHKKDGKQIKEKELFNNYSPEKLSSLILESLTAKYGDSLKDVLFDEAEVRPNSNFYFGETGLVYVYNEYEIAPYSEGLIEVTVPYSKLEGMVSQKYKEKVKID